MGHPDAFERNLEDGGVAWPSMTDAQRQASAIDTGHLLWMGPTVVAHAGVLLAGRAGNGRVRMFAPNPDQPGSSVSHWDTTCTPDQLMEPVYTKPIHDPSLTRDALTDVGWGGGGDGGTTTTVTTSTSTTTIPLVCPPTPAAGCRAAATSSLKIVDGSPDAKDRVAWSWKGSGTAVADFRDPRATSALRFCLYDASGGAQPLIAPRVVPGGRCGRHACWKPLGKNGYAYRNKRATPDGFVAVRLKATAGGQGRITLRGKGVNLPVSPLPLVPPVTVDLFVGDGIDNACWQATFTAAKRSDVGFFKAKAP
jgi:hypothetical protein